MLNLVMPQSNPQSAIWDLEFGILGIDLLNAIYVSKHYMIQFQTVFDDENQHYLLMLVGPEETRRVHGCLIHLDIDGVATTLKTRYPNASHEQCQTIAYAIVSMANGSSTMVGIGFARVPAVQAVVKQLIQTLEAH